MCGRSCARSPVLDLLLYKRVQNGLAALNFGVTPRVRRPRLDAVSPDLQQGDQHRSLVNHCLLTCSKKHDGKFESLPPLGH
jgi:hypothetical protein